MWQKVLILSHKHKKETKEIRKKKIYVNKLMIFVNILKQMKEIKNQANIIKELRIQ